MLNELNEFNFYITDKITIHILRGYPAITVFTCVAVITGAVRSESNMAMIFEAAEPIVQFIGHLTRLDEDPVDRLNHKYSTIIFCLLAIIGSTTQFVGDPIKCVADASFPSSWVEYTNAICWISNTYYIPMSDTDVVNASRKEVVYYQWVPLVLFLQAFIFYTPSLFWSAFGNSNGFDIHKTAQLLSQTEHMNPTSRDSCTRLLTKQIDQTLLFNRQMAAGTCDRIWRKMARCGCMCPKHHGNFLITIYFIKKLLYLTIALLQLYLLTHLLDTDYTLYGIEATRDLINSGDFQESPRFPRVTLCDFEVRSIGRNIPRTAQCTLPVNLFNEKIFIFVWFWLVLLAGLGILSLIYWMWIIFASSRLDYFKKCLKVYHKYDRRNDRLKLRAFSNIYLRNDGYFLMRMISKNTNEVVTGEIIASLWDTFSRAAPINTTDMACNV